MTTATMDDTTMEDNERVVEEISLYFLLFAGMLALVIILSKILHDHPRFNSVFSEATLTLLIGVLAGFFVHYVLFLHEPDPYESNYSLSDEVEDDEVVTVATSLLSFDRNVFFMALLPPILFQSGYAIRRELFYRHIKPILMYACIGTTISALSTAFMLQGVSLLGWMGPDSNLNSFNPSLLELLTFGSLIAATDTVSVLAVFQAKQVDPHLFYLVFGESALNDAVALVLFRTFAGSVNADGTIASRATACIIDFSIEFVGSPMLGIGIGFCTALLFKHMDFRSRPMLELPLYIVLLLYVPFITAEFLHLSGIVTIFFSGTAARRYIAPNVSVQTAHNAEVIFKTAAYLAETCIFLELGLSVVGLAKSFKWRFIAWAFLAALLGRALAIFPLTWIHNISLKTAQPHPNGSVTLGSGSNPDDDDITVMSTVSNMLTSEWKTPKRRMDKQIANKFAAVLWFAGMRGAVAYACAKDFPVYYGHSDEFTAATMFIVLFTIVIFGGLLETLLDILNIQTGIDFEEYMKEWHKRRRLEGRFHRFEHQYIYRTVVRADTDSDNSMAPIEEAVSKEEEQGEDFGYVAHGGHELVEMRSQLGYNSNDSANSNTTTRSSYKSPVFVLDGETSSAMRYVAQLPTDDRSVHNHRCT